jgi:hypothetical protein
MSMSVKGHLAKEALIGGVSNAIFNGWIAWLLMRNGPDLLWTGKHSFVVDIVATAFLLPLIVALIVIPLHRKKLRKGKLQPIELAPGTSLRSLVDRFPGGVFRGSLLFGLIGTATFAPLALLGFYAAGIESISPAHYSTFKGVWAGLMAAVLVVPMVLVALRAGERAGAPVP